MTKIGDDKVIDTAEERGIKTEEINRKTSYQEEQEETEENGKKETYKELDPVEEEHLVEAEEEEHEPEPEDPYTALINSDPELKLELDYRNIMKKLETGEALTPEEEATKMAIDEQIVKQQEEFAKQEKMKEEAKARERVDVEYKKTKEEAPEKIIKINEKNESIGAASNIPAILKFIIKLKKVKKKGGKILVYVFQSRNVVFKVTNEDINFAEFHSKDDNGTETLTVTRFTEHKYSFEGTPIPVLFAVEGFAEGYDFFKDFKKDLDSELLKQVSLRSFHAGFLKGAEVRPPQDERSKLEQLQPVAVAALVFGMIAIAYMLYMMWQRIDAMPIQELIRAANTIREAQTQNFSGTIGLIKWW